MSWLIETQGTDGKNVFYTKDGADLKYALEMLGKYDLTEVYWAEFRRDQNPPPAE